MQVVRVGGEERYHLVSYTERVFSHSLIQVVDSCLQLKSSQEQTTAATLLPSAEEHPNRLILHSKKIVGAINEYLVEMETLWREN